MTAGAGDGPAREMVAVAFAGDRGALAGSGLARTGTVVEVVRDAARLEAERSPRWVWWAADRDAAPLVAGGLRVARCWDLAEVHRLLHGGLDAPPPLVWALARGLDPASVPPPRTGDLFDLVGDDDDAAGDDAGGGGAGGAAAGGDAEGRARALLTRAGHLRPAAADPEWLAREDHLLGWAEAALRCADGQAGQLARAARGAACALSESAAALLCVELARDGLPLDRAAAEVLVADAAGPRPRSEADAESARRARDEAVLAHVPDHARADLRNPAEVRAMLAAVGVVVPSTRKGVLDAHRGVHPVVEALLQWRARERIATTYGYRWLDENVGPDDRLRGAWTASDGAAGRMTAQHGLHSLPAVLRPAVRAESGHVLVRADLGQVEPRVLAVVSGDADFAAASRSADLYAPVAQALGVERAVAKVAVLAAMYGQRSGAAGEALAGLERQYPTAMALLDRAYAAGSRGEPVRTWGGRLVRTGRLVPVPEDAPPEVARAREAARGRFARNAVIQGSAAELFKAWAATVRAATRGLGAGIVLCLHDELLVHAREDVADEVAAVVEAALTDAARRWSGAAPVRFVADTRVVRRWSEAKD